MGGFLFVCYMVYGFNWFFEYWISLCVLSVFDKSSCYIGRESSKKPYQWGKKTRKREKEKWIKQVSLIFTLFLLTGCDPETNFLVKVISYEMSLGKTNGQMGKYDWEEKEANTGYESNQSSLEQSSGQCEPHLKTVPISTERSLFLCWDLPHDRADGQPYMSFH